LPMGLGDGGAAPAAFVRQVRLPRGKAVPKTPEGEIHPGRQISSRGGMAGARNRRGCGHTGTVLSDQPRRSFRATEAQSMAAHESPRTTMLYDRTKERFTQDRIERIVM
jgi:hypothetical protein